MKPCQSCGMPLNKDPQGGGRNTWKSGNNGGCCGTLVLIIVLFIIFALLGLI